MTALVADAACTRFQRQGLDLLPVCGTLYFEAKKMFVLRLRGEFAAHALRVGGAWAGGPPGRR